MDRGIKIININKKCLIPFKHKNKFSSALLNSVVNAIRNILNKSRYPTSKLYKHLRNTDVIFYSWPYKIEPLPYNSQVKAMVDKKVFFIPHDFIYTHCVYSKGEYLHEEAMEIYWQHEKFLKTATPIVSIEFIKRELKRTFPESSADTKVVYLSG